MSTWRRVFVHLVWGTKSRRPMITARHEEVIFGTCAVQAKRLESEILAIGGSDDHMHALAVLHPTTALTALVRAMKSATTVMVNKHVDTEDTFAWQRGYAAITVSPEDVPAVADYVRNQRERHRERRLEGRWEPPLDELRDDD